MKKKRKDKREDKREDNGETMIKKRKDNFLDDAPMPGKKQLETSAKERTGATPMDIEKIPQLKGKEKGSETIGDTLPNSQENGEVTMDIESEEENKKRRKKEKIREEGNEGKLLNESRSIKRGKEEEKAPLPFPFYYGPDKVLVTREVTLKCLRPRYIGTKKDIFVPTTWEEIEDRRKRDEKKPKPKESQGTNDKEEMRTPLGTKQMEPGGSKEADWASKEMKGSVSWNEESAYTDEGQDSSFYDKDDKDESDNEFTKRDLLMDILCQRAFDEGLIGAWKQGKEKEKQHSPAGMSLSVPIEKEEDSKEEGKKGLGNKEEEEKGNNKPTTFVAPAKKPVAKKPKPLFAAMLNKLASAD